MAKSNIIDDPFTGIPSFTPNDQLPYIRQLLQTPLRVHDTWFLVPFGWYQRWQSQSSDRVPGPIDTSIFYDDDGLFLTLDMVQDQHYVLVPNLAWRALAQWYGCFGQPVGRQVVQEDDVNQTLLVEVYPPTFKLYALAQAPEEKPPLLTVPSSTPVKQFVPLALKALGLPSSVNAHLYHVKDDPKLPNAFVTNLSMLASDVEYLHLEDTDGKTTMRDHSLSQGTILIMCGDHHQLTPSLPVQVGAVGLYNLGHTCFMNSALQCLSNTETLTNWFLAGKYKQELNHDNPLGMGGALATSYAGLLRDIWQGQAPVLTPRDFRYHIGQFNEMFKAYQRQDAQELVATLLDGLHEDLNRVDKKPYMDLSEQADLPEKEFANLSWSYHKSRNDSIISDLFHGQFRSVLTCTVCSKTSTTFDPFMYLSLPLPSRQERSVPVSFIPLDPALPIKHLSLSLDKKADIHRLKIAVATQAGLQESTKLLVVEISENKWNKVLSNGAPLAMIAAAATLYVYELPCVPGDPAWTVFPVYCQRTPVGFNHLRNCLAAHFCQPVAVAMLTKDLSKPNALSTSIARQLRRHRHAITDDVSQDSLPPSVLLKIVEPELADDDFPVGKALWQCSLPKLHPPMQLRQGQGILLEWWPDHLVEHWFGTLDFTPACSSPPEVPKKHQATLMDCLHEFTKQETLQDVDAWLCPECQQHQPASKKIDLWRLPDTLVILLKRFQQTPGGWYDKLDDDVAFPDRLDLTDQVLGDHTGSLVYELYAVNNHVGQDTLHGHCNPNQSIPSFSL
ncbi:cysteine proteinase [Hesseltinella vesiculosa]|uniref:ubiquitinyl hydrolase 1 n=1 Tax=Hesseltinella vesiculosa TaxID=101127 RepID=A0A1X2G7Y1_9FUNG|nr:cysteine proteinase [Hesseltinella vesiculosa]